ncbi:MAG: 2-hydroxyacid dehydrogenase [Sphingobacteriales bacterium]|nr:MAG: 2-hydroxyacid dehydrogenase [Sphingobacteriales bacterium]
MKVAVFSLHKFEKDYLLSAAKGKHELILLEPQLSLTTAGLAEGCKAVCIFVNDDGSKDVLKKISALGIKYMALRSAGFNHVDIKKAYELGMRVARVPEYSPYAVAEHTVALMLALNRKLVVAHNRIRDLNFSLNGLTGFDMHNKTIGIIGTGKIGKIVAEILHGFGCRVLAYDIMQDDIWANKYGVVYGSIDNVCSQSDIITLHAPLTEQTKYIINRDRIAKMKKAVMLINTSRGALVNTKDVIIGLKSGQIGYLGLDVYEEERGLFFEDHSSDILQDDVIARLMTFPNVLITSHQAFLTDTALHNIAVTTMENLDCFEKGEECKNELMP